MKENHHVPAGKSAEDDHVIFDGSVMKENECVSPDDCVIKDGDCVITGDSVINENDHVPAGKSAEDDHVIFYGSVMKENECVSPDDCVIKDDDCVIPGESVMKGDDHVPAGESAEDNHVIFDESVLKENEHVTPDDCVIKDDCVIPVKSVIKEDDHAPAGESEEDDHVMFDESAMKVNVMPGGCAINDDDHVIPDESFVKKDDHAMSEPGMKENEHVMPCESVMKEVEHVMPGSSVLKDYVTPNDCFIEQKAENTSTFVTARKRKWKMSNFTMEKKARDVLNSNTVNTSPYHKKLRIRGQPEKVEAEAEGEALETSIDNGLEVSAVKSDELDQQYEEDSDDSDDDDYTPESESSDNDDYKPDSESSDNDDYKLVSKSSDAEFGRIDSMKIGREDVFEFDSDEDSYTGNEFNALIEKVISQETTCVTSVNTTNDAQKVAEDKDVSTDVETAAEDENVLEDAKITTDNTDPYAPTASGHKKHPCLYCGLLGSKLPRHLERHHKGEEEVREALAFPKKSKERSLCWRKITRRGDYKHNIETLKGNKENISVVRKMKDSTYIDYVPCTYCYGFFASKQLYKHQKQCFAKPNADRLGKPNLASSRIMLTTAVIDGKYRDVHTKIIDKMNKRDQAYLIIRNDDTLLMYGAVELLKRFLNVYFYKDSVLSRPDEDDDGECDPDRDNSPTNSIPSPPASSIQPSPEDSTCPSSSRVGLLPITKKRHKTWTQWSTEEMTAIQKAFRHNIMQKVLPQHHEILTAIKNYPILEKRGNKKVKDKVRNEIVKVHKNQK